MLSPNTEGDRVNPRRRAFLTAPGESLLVCTSPVEAALRAEMLSRLTGIPPQSLLTNALCAIPLPLYPEQFTGARRWPSVQAGAMWHPLLWLPERIAKRRPVPDGPAGIESDDLWVVRVALELSATGVYDDVTGTWIDVLSLMGLGTDSADDIARVRRWLDGADDELLGSFDLTDHMLPRTGGVDTSRSLDVAEMSLGPLRASAWAYAATDLLDACREIAEATTGTPREQPRLAVAMIIRLAMLAFAGIDGEWAWWSGARQHLETSFDDADLVIDMLPTLAEHLSKLHAAYAPMARLFSMSMRSISASS